MPKIEELKPILKPVLTRAGIDEATISTIFDEGATLGDDAQTVLSNQLETLTTKKAALADQDIRNQIIRNTMESMEEKIKASALGLKNRKLTDSQLAPIWEKKQLTEKVAGILALVDKVDAPEGMVAKTELDAAAHTIQELKDKIKAGSKGWEDTLNQQKSAYEKLQKQLEQVQQAHQDKLTEIANRNVNSHLLSYVKGKITGKPWHIQSTEQEILKRARQHAQFIQTESGDYVARNKDNPDLEVFGADHNNGLTPEQIVIKIANEMEVLDKAGAGGAGSGQAGSQSRLPGIRSGSAQGGGGSGGSQGRKLSGAHAERQAANQAQFDQILNR